VRVMVVGQGYVGLVAATGLANAGHDVVGVERDPARLRLLERGACPVYEPGLHELLTHVRRERRLTFTALVGSATGPFDAAIVTVDSPQTPSGAADTTDVEFALRQVFAIDPVPSVVINRSTIPPGTSATMLTRAANGDSFRSRYVYTPEFLSQGMAIADWCEPSRVVIGLWNEELLPLVDELFRSISAPRIVTGPTDAEMIKYASNAFLATKVSFVNEIANLCDRLGVTVDTVVAGLRLDPRMGAGFWRPGLGYGDSCLPKDVRALIQHAAELGYRMRVLESVEQVNQTQHSYPVRLIDDALRAAPPGTVRVAVLGLAYEPHSDDMRAAPSRQVVPALGTRAVEVRVWDRLLPAEQVARLFPGTGRCESVNSALVDAGIAVVLTEYPELSKLDWASVARNMTEPGLVIDAKNCLDPEEVRNAGLAYRGVGRPA
jgi:UDPglucose 6-dehydrogenase